MIAQKSPEMKVPVDKLLEINQDSHARMLYEAREKERRDNMAMQRRARMEGIQDVAKKLLAMNMPIENIVGATGLTIEELENL